MLGEVLSLETLADSGRGGRGKVLHREGRC